MRSSQISRYILRGRKHVKGFFGRRDAEIISTIMLDQSRRGVKGDALEIGVHHGRSFILVGLCLGHDETAIAIDIFDRQDLNIGSPSGKGDLVRFKANIARYGISANTRIVSSSSLDVSPEDLRSLTSGFRFISVDGAHWFGAVVNDLRLAEANAAQNCVIAVDDIFHPDYPDVAAGFYAWWHEKPQFEPLCVSSGKLFLCRPGEKKAYFEALLENDYLRFNCKKRMEFMGQEILVLTGRYRGLRGLVSKYLQFYAPGVYRYLKARMGKPHERRLPPSESRVRLLNSE